MNTRFSKLLRAAAILLLAGVRLIGHAQDFTYTTGNGAVTIIKYIGAGADVDIPRQIDGLPVTTIGHGAFFSCTNVLTIAIPDTVTSIAEIVFNGCISLAAFNVAPANPAFCSADDILFNKAQTALLRCPLVKAGSYSVPSTVTTIAPYAFDSCTGLVGITLPDSVTTIGRDAFFWCTSLGSITIPPRVSNIQAWTFGYGRNLTNFTILGGVTNIGDWAFYESRLSTVTLPDTLISLGAGVFSGGYFLTNIILGSGLTSIGNSAFEGDSQLTAVYFRGNAPTTGTYVFRYADLVTAYYLPGATGWEDTFAGRPTALWLPQIQASDPDFGVRADQFGFNVLWTRGMSVVVEASQSLTDPIWSALSTNTLTEDTGYFTDPDWKNHSSRLYRVRSP